MICRAGTAWTWALRSSGPAPRAAALCAQAVMWAARTACSGSRMVQGAAQCGPPGKCCRSSARCSAQQYQARGQLWQGMAVVGESASMHKWQTCVAQDPASLPAGVTLTRHAYGSRVGAHFCALMLAADHCHGVLLEQEGSLLHLAHDLQGAPF